MPTRRNVRWDRVVVAAVLLIILIFVFGSCVRSCSEQEPAPISSADSSSAAGSTTTTTGSGTTTSAPAGSSAGTTTTTVSGTTANVPVIITDPDFVDPTVSTTSATTTTESGSSGEPIYMLPAGYEEAAMPSSAMYKGTLVLVNKNNPSHLSMSELDLEQVYFAADKPDTYVVSYPGYTTLDKTALGKFNRLMKQYYIATSNSEIMFNYGYLETGKEHSNPESATGLDIQLHIKRSDGGYEYISNTAPYSWMFEHMASYGYVQRYAADKTELTGERGSYTAIRYVGVPHAAYMYANNLCLEEYLDMLKNEHNFYRGTILEYSTSELTYHVYYVAASTSSDTTKVPVPTTGTYEISGNNVDGFIVTAIVG